MARKMPARPRVTMMTEITGSPIMGRRMRRSMSRPRTIEKTERHQEGSPKGCMIVVRHAEERVGAHEEELALGEVHDAARLVDDDEAERDERVDAADGEAVDDELEQELHYGTPRTRTASSVWMRAVLPS